MKKLVVTLLLTSIGITSIAQKLQITEVKYKAGKQVAKAEKKGRTIQMGNYWNDDKSALYKFTAFTPKKSTKQFFEVVKINESGSIENTEIIEDTEANLEKYKLKRPAAEASPEQQELKGYEVAFIRNPVMAGTPTLVMGKFVDRYTSTKAGSIWTGYKFSKQSKKDLNDNFWSFVSFPLDAPILDKNNHLIAASTTLGKALEGFGTRQYLPADGKAYVGGMKAVSSANIFISGVLDVKNSKWENVTDIDVEMRMLPNGYDHQQLANGNTQILLRSADEYKLLTVDSKGNKKQLVTLSIPQSGGKVNLAPSTKMMEEKDHQLIAISTYHGLAGKKVGLAISKISNGKETAFWNFSNEDLINKAQLPPKQKLKLNRFKYMEIRSIRKLKNNDYLVDATAKYDRINSSEKVFLAMQVTKEGQLKACYLMEGLKAPKDMQISLKAQPIPASIVEMENGFYWVERATLVGDEKGIQTDMENFGIVTNYYAFRIDDTYAIGQIVKVNTGNQSISNMVVPDSRIIGTRINQVSKNGSLILNTFTGTVVIK